MKCSTTIMLLMLLILTACAAGKNTPTPTIVPLGSATAQNWSQLDAALLTVIRTPLPNSTPTFTLTPTESQIMTLTPSISIVQPQTEVIVSWLNIRQGPGVDYPIIGVARIGDVFDIIGVNPAGDWLQVIIENGESGWISGKLPYTRLLNIELDDIPVSQPPPQPSSPTTLSEATRIMGSNRDLSGKLVFMTCSGGELYVINIDGSGLRRLTGGIIDPVISPNGQQVAFTRWDGAELGTLYTINLDGSGERAILSDILQPKSPTWSPDGKQIMVSFQYGGLRNPKVECRSFDLDDTIRIPNNVTIIKIHVGVNDIDICFQRNEDLHWRLRRVDVETGRYDDINSDEYSYNPTWDPWQSWRVLYDGDKGLMQLDVTNGNLQPLTTDLRDTGPVFSPDGRRLSLTYRQHDHWEVYTFDLETRIRRRLTKPPILADPQYNSAAPTWSPDGTHIAFVTDRNGQWEIWVMNADGSNQHPLFLPEIQAQLRVEYHGVNERMLNWIESP